MKRNRHNTAGFSLVEVNMAILLVALGMLLLFALFPAALRESEQGVSDTNVGLFADFVMSGLEANASVTTNWNTWANMTTFSNAVAGAQLMVTSPNSTPDGNQVLGDGTIRGPVFYSGRYVKYILMLSGAQNNRLRSAILWVRSGEYGPTSAADFMSSSRMFYTELFFTGM